MTAGNALLVKTHFILHPRRGLKASPDPALMKILASGGGTQVITWMKISKERMKVFLFHCGSIILILFFLIVFLSATIFHDMAIFLVYKNVYGNTIIQNDGSSSSLP